MFLEFINNYGMEILSTVLTALAGYIGIVLKNLYKKYVDDSIKKSVIKTVVQGVEQLYKDLHGEEKLNVALENAAEMLSQKNITFTEFELKMLIEAAVGEFNNVFNKTEKSE